MLPVIRYTCYLAPHCWQVITPDDFLVNFVPSWYTRVLQFLHYAPLAGGISPPGIFLVPGLN